MQNILRKCKNIIFKVNSSKISSNYLLSIGSPFLSEFSSVPVRIVPYRIVPYRTVSYRIVPYRTVSYRIVRIVPYRTVSYRTIPQQTEWDLYIVLKNSAPFERI
jgi:hypothetical protein